MAIDWKAGLSGNKRPSGNGRDYDPPPRFRFQSGREIEVPPLQQDTVVRAVLHKGTITGFYGAPKSGKSFLVTDLARAVADYTKTNWMGHNIKQHGPVLYCACEGYGGFWKRMQAAGEPTPEHLVLMSGRPILVENSDGKGYTWSPRTADIETGIQWVEAKFGCPPLVIVIDTVFRSFGAANVNDSSNMMAYIAACTELAERGIAVLLVHHATKAGGTPSGSVAFIGAVETLCIVARNEAGCRSWRIEFAKDDAEDGEERGFELEVVHGIIDAFGDEVSSCKVKDLGEKAKETAQKTGRKPKIDRRDMALVILQELQAKTADPRDDGKNVFSVHVDDWRSEFYTKTMPGQKQDTKLKAFNSAVKRLVAIGSVEVSGDHVRCS